MGKNLRLEVSFEVNTGVRTSIEGEYRMGNLVLGLSYRNLGDFYSYNYIVTNDLYRLRTGQDVNEIGFNFAYGSQKGHSFGVGVGIVDETVQETNFVYREQLSTSTVTEQTWETENKQTTLSAKYGYTF